jgi:hypothetical protein
MEQKEVESGLYHKPLRLLPVFFSKDIERVYWDWVLPREENAPKPRNLYREKEIPPEDLSLDNLSNVIPFVEVLPALKISPDGKEIREIPEYESDVLVISGGQEDFIHIIRQYGIPILPFWDNWGYIWNIRYLPGRDSFTYTPFGAEEIKQVLRVLHALKFINSLKIIYFGDMPSHTVSESNYDFNGLQRRLGVSFVKKELDDYVRAVGEVSDDDSQVVADKWKKYEIPDNREDKFNFFAKIYVALKKLLIEEGAFGLTVDCAALPNADYVPCFSVSSLIDEGYVWACEGDVSALLSMAFLMGISNQPALMGNIFENNTHQDIEENIIVINHDIVPPSMGRSGCSLKLRDFHGTGKGLTGYIDLPKGETVTLVGISPSAKELWVIPGEILWTEDTVHCRIAVGIKVGNAKQIAREFGGHHIAMSYGNWINDITMLSGLMGIEPHLIK